jgi:hypothetical protein
VGTPDPVVKITDAVVLLISFTSLQSDQPPLPFFFFSDEAVRLGARRNSQRRAGGCPRIRPPHANPPLSLSAAAGDRCRGGRTVGARLPSALRAAVAASARRCILVGSVGFTAPNKRPGTNPIIIIHICITGQLLELRLKAVGGTARDDQIKHKILIRDILLRE